jgi:hypothetical protein
MKIIHIRIVVVKKASFLDWQLHRSKQDQSMQHEAIGLALDVERNLGTRNFLFPSVIVRGLLPQEPGGFL